MVWSNRFLHNLFRELELFAPRVRANPGCAVQWLECFPQGPLGARYLRDKLLPFDALPRNVSRRQVLL